MGAAMTELPVWSGELTDVDAVNAHIDAWQEIVGPAGWEIRYSPLAPDDGEERASTNLNAIQRRGVIRIRAEAPASQVDRLIVHAAAYLRGQWTRSQEWLIERLTSLVTGSTKQYWHDDAAWTSAFPVSA